MKCSLNNCTVHTVGEVRRCARCYDGTAEQIPAEIADDALLQDAITAKPGLGNRFKEGGDPPPAAEPAIEAEAGAEPAPKGKKTK